MGKARKLRRAKKALKDTLIGQTAEFILGCYGLPKDVSLLDLYQILYKFYLHLLNDQPPRLGVIEFTEHDMEPSTFVFGTSHLVCLDKISTLEFEEDTINTLKGFASKTDPNYSRVIVFRISKNDSSENTIGSIKLEVLKKALEEYQNGLLGHSQA